MTPGTRAHAARRAGRRSWLRLRISDLLRICFARSRMGPPLLRSPPALRFCNYWLYRHPFSAVIEISIVVDTVFQLWDCWGILKVRGYWHV